MNENEIISIDRIIENLIYIHPLLSKSLTRSIRTKTNLNPGSLFILGLLSKYDILSMSEIGCKLSIPKPHVTAQIDKLIAEEMVERLYDANDRRIINIKLTEKGKNDFSEIKMDISLEMRQHIEKLNNDKLKILYDSSINIREILTEMLLDTNLTNGTNCNKEL